MTTAAVLFFEGTEELDAIGPWEVFTMTSRAKDDFSVFSLSEKGGLVTCAKGLKIETDYSIENAPDFDILLVPGGRGTRVEVHNQVLLSWIAEKAPSLEWITSVCTGSMVLTAAGPAAGKRVTTHWGAMDEIRALEGVGEVLENVRYVRDGNIVTSAGVSAGIDMALWLVGQIYDPATARTVQRNMEYDPAPPYAAEV
jgi:transcriptional regulator GlxA family with amidase domain